MSVALRLRVRAEGAAACAHRVSAAAGHRGRREARRKRDRASVQSPDRQHRQLEPCRSAKDRGVRAHGTAARAGGLSEVRHARASIDVKQPTAEPEEAGERRAQEQSAEAAGAADARSADAPVRRRQQPTPARRRIEAGLVEQGWTTSVRETLTPEAHGDRPDAADAAAAASRSPKSAVVVVETNRDAGHGELRAAAAAVLHHVGVSDSRNRRGPFAGRFAVPLLEPLTPPEKVDLDLYGRRDFADVARAARRHRAASDGCQRRARCTSRHLSRRRACRADESNRGDRRHDRDLCRCRDGGHGRTCSSQRR